MAKAANYPVESSPPKSSSSTIDRCAVIPILAFFYASIVTPLVAFFAPRGDTLRAIMESSWENRVFWPVMAASAIGLAVSHRSRLNRLTLPPHIVCLLAYLALAGTSVLWAFRPELSFIRFVQQMLIITSIVLPTMLVARTTDVMRGVFLCLAFGLILNLLAGAGPPGKSYEGYFLNKNAMGQFAAITLLLAAHEIFYPGVRRVLGGIVVVGAGTILLLSNSKTAIAFGFLAPFVAAFLLLVRKTLRVSPAIVLLSLVLCLALFSKLSGFNANRLSSVLFGDPTFTGRTVIWDFAAYEISRRPLLGWGYLSFWLVGPDAPSVVDAPGWVKMMPQAHNGYFDTMLATGYVGFILLMIFIFATFHVIGRVADRNPTRAWLALSITLFVALNNFLESTWVRGAEMLWVLFVIVAADIGRYWQSYPPTRLPYRVKPQRPGGLGSRPARRGPLSPRSTMAVPVGSRRPRSPA